MTRMEDLLEECCGEKVSIKSITEILNNIIDRVDRLEKKSKRLEKKLKRLRATEDEELKRGDVVECRGGAITFTGILYGVFDGYYWILDKSSLVPQKIPMSEWVVVKLGKHVDIFKESED